MHCNYCDYEGSIEEFEGAARLYGEENGLTSYDERCPRCDEPRMDYSYDDHYEPPEPEPSPLDEFVQEVFPPGDAETLSDRLSDEYFE